ncbi:EF hand family protein [Trichomonas vaginalis G3]|uniref:EF hand family protein n=1 Tax=Trichomonas vaginalis (strain ATCC PRA-98 / G3) TaxID=412133 RepID=A2FI83_TRIV3|nr:EF hand family protein [Trichomonas vaginalis G3]|eukprot:XP_001308295.1 EF hand family protein [Trichomonas vaginalis G3]
MKKNAPKISETSYFTEKPVHILASLFRKLTAKFHVDLKTFCNTLEITNTDIGEILYKIIDSDGSGNLNFLEFVQGLNVFHPSAPLEKKVEMCFKAYDSDGSGLVSKDEILKVLKISLRNNNLIEFEEAKINLLANQLIKEYSRNNSGELRYDEFYKMVINAPGVIESFDLDLNSLFR